MNRLLTENHANAERSFDREKFDREKFDRENSAPRISE